MKILVTGVSGLLGLNFALHARGRADLGGTFHRHPVALDGVRTFDVDVAMDQDMRRVIETFGPDAIVHTVGLTSVDVCEQEPACAERLNVDAAAAVAAAAHASGAHLVHISTDQLFDGTRPFAREDTATAPMNVYGRTKRAAEQAVLAAAPDAAVIRTNFFGWGTSIRASFSDWILASLERGDPLHMFSDAFFTPILVNDLSALLLDIIDRRTSGVLHVCGSERLTKYAFAQRLAREFGIEGASIVPRPLASFGLRAERPLDMSLDTARARALFGRDMPDVDDGLRRLRELRDRGWPQQLEAALTRASRV